jgi:hypothetical protein
MDEQDWRAACANQRPSRRSDAVVPLARRDADHDERGTPDCFEQPILGGLGEEWLDVDINETLDCQRGVGQEPARITLPS